KTFFPYSIISFIGLIGYGYAVDIVNNNLFIVANIDVCNESITAESLAAPNSSTTATDASLPSRFLASADIGTSVLSLFKHFISELVILKYLLNSGDISSVFFISAYSIVACSLLFAA